MRIYWYWPHPHSGPNTVGLELVRAGNDLIVDALAAYRGESLRAVSEYEVRRVLPDPLPRIGRIHRAARRMIAPFLRVGIRRRTLRERFDVAYVETITYEIDAFDLPRLAKHVPVVARVHDIEPHRTRLPRAVQRALWRRVYRSDADWVVAHESLVPLLETKYEVSRERIHVVPLPLSDRSGTHVRVVPSGQLSVLFIGSFRPNKGIPLLIDAARQIAGEPIAFTIVGAGDRKLEKLVEEAATELGNVVAEVGRYSEQRKWELLNSCDLVVLPYTSFASQSGVLMDAYAVRKPVLVTDVGALGDSVRSDGTGVVVEQGRADALAEALCALASAPIDTFSEALQAAARRHDPHAVADALDAVYRKARLRHSRPEAK